MSLSSPKAETFEFQYVVVVVLLLVVVVIIVIILMMKDYGLEVLAKTPGLYQVPKLRNFLR